MLTFWAKCRFPEGFSEPPWVLKEVSPGNLAAFATRIFEAGEVILIEAPTVIVRGWHPFTLEQQRSIEERVAALNVDDRNAFFDMANVFEAHSIEEVEEDHKTKGTSSKVTRGAGIFMTNCFDMTDCPDGDSCAIYAAIARLNHSCQPNAQQTHLPDTGEEVLIASRTILIGEEICDCYIDLRQSTAKRRAVLSDLFRFHCQCPACTSASADEDDRLRERAAKYEGDILTAAAEMDAGIALDIALGSVRLLDNPRAHSWSVRYIADAHMSVHQLAIELGQKSLAAEHITKAHYWNQRLTSSESPASKSSLALLHKKGRTKKK